MQIWMMPLKIAVVVRSKYVDGDPSLKQVGGGGPALLVVRVVIPPCVTLLKVSDTGEFPVTGSTGCARMPAPMGVFGAITRLCCARGPWSTAITPLRLSTLTGT